jgi:hypothetical protein
MTGEENKVSVMPGSNDSWDYFITFLPKKWEEMCRELNALRRFREFPDAKSLLRTLMIHLLDGCSLRETSVRARYGKIADVSDVALLKRLNLAGAWFQWMAQEIMREWIGKNGGLPGPEITRPIIAVDATCISEPGSTGTDWRIHYAFDLRKLECAEMNVTDHSKGETFKNFSVVQDALYIGDRGYYQPEGIGHIVKGGAHVLVRMSISGPTLYKPNGKTFNVLKSLRRLKGDHVGDWPVYFQGHDGPTHGRICAIRKSPIAAQRAIEKIYREYGKKQKTPTAATIEAAKYVFIFTTLPPSELPAAKALNFYRGRWQIELVFKRMKSILGVGHLPKQDPVGAKAWIQGKLFCAMVIEALTRAADFFSPWGYPLASEKAA